MLCLKFYLKMISTAFTKVFFRDTGGGPSGKEPTCQYRKPKRCRFDPWVGKILWTRKWQPTQVFLPRKSYGQRSLVGPRTWRPKESDTTEHLTYVV